MRRISFILLLTVLAFASCRFSWGGCPKVNYELNSFNATNYMGRWFELMRENTIPFEKGVCQEANYTLNKDGSVKVVNREFLRGNWSVAEGRAEPTENPFQFKISFTTGWISKYVKGDYQVINTDYNNFSVVYSCTDLFVARFEYFWILSRNSTVTTDRLEDFASYLNRTFGFQPKEIHYSPQVNCTRPY